MEEATKIKNELAPLLPRSMADESAKKFDVLMLDIELSKLVSEVNANRSQNKVVQIASLLKEKASIPQVMARMVTIEEVLYTRILGSSYTFPFGEGEGRTP